MNKSYPRSEETIGLEMTLGRRVWKCFAAMLLGAGCYASSAQADEQCAKTTVNRQWSASCFEHVDSGRRVKKEFRKNIVVDRSGVAVVVIDAPAEIVAVSKRGRVVPLWEAHLSGFGFEPSDGEVARVSYLWKTQTGEQASKCGYFEGRHTNILVPPIYDGCESFRDGSAQVCLACTLHCPSGDCHELEFIGGEGMLINKNNEVLKRFALPTLPKCRQHGKPRNADVPGEDKDCIPQSRVERDDPFTKLP